MTISSGTSRPSLRIYQPAHKPNLIIAFCPNFGDEGEGLRDGVSTLDTLNAKYKLHFFVLRHPWDDDRAPISDSAVKIMREYGIVEIFEQRAEAPRRAKAFSEIHLGASTGLIEGKTMTVSEHVKSCSGSITVLTTIGNEDARRALQTILRKAQEALERLKKPSDRE